MRQAPGVEGEDAATKWRRQAAREIEPESRVIRFTRRVRQDPSLDHE